MKYQKFTPLRCIDIGVIETWSLWQRLNSKNIFKLITGLPVAVRGKKQNLFVLIKLTFIKKLSKKKENIVLN